MTRLTPLRALVLLGPPLGLAIALVTLAALQLNAWQLNWVWALVGLGVLVWRWSVARLLRAEAPVVVDLPVQGLDAAQAERARVLLRDCIEASRGEVPVWEDWEGFWRRCLALVTAIADLCHPEADRPLLQIRVGQAYGLLRGTVDDLDRWMAQLGPQLDRVTVGQAVQAYELGLRAAPWIRQGLQLWELAQWWLNPAVALAREAGRSGEQEANRLLLQNLGQLLREAALENLWRRSLQLYAGEAPPLTPPPPVVASVDTASLRDLLEANLPPVEQAIAPLQILLLGRTGAGKSSLINSLFATEQAHRDLLPSTTILTTYAWDLPEGGQVQLIDSPGYGQGEVDEARLATALASTDLVLLLLPATDPALGTDHDWLIRIPESVPVIGLVTQVDRLRPAREWSPPYDWEVGDRPKEQAIREAVAYRRETLGDRCTALLPLVNSDPDRARPGWNLETLTRLLLQVCPGQQQAQLAMVLRDRQTCLATATTLVARYRDQVELQQDLTAALKTPLLQGVGLLVGRNAALGALLARQLPIEQVPLAIGKLQLAAQLLQLLGRSLASELVALIPAILDPQQSLEQFATALLSRD